MIDYRLIYKLFEIKGFGKVKVNSILSQFLQQANYVKSDVNLKLISFIENEIKEELCLKKIDSDVRSIEKYWGMPIHFIDFSNELYPKSLNLLGNKKPPIIACIGNIEILKKHSIGFCGSRNATEKGYEVARDISEQVSMEGISIVSGYASGIDMETHYTALKNNGSTVIVLPEGLKSFKIKTKIKEVWDWNNVLVISEFPMDAIWSVSRAMERNSTIVSLSEIMVLIEARSKGGSIDAGIKTLQLNKSLFAPIYEGMPEEASGNQFLLEKGAFPLKKSKETHKANLNRMFEIFNQGSKCYKGTLFD